MVASVEAELTNSVSCIWQKSAKMQDALDVKVKGLHELVESEVRTLPFLHTPIPIHSHIFLLWSCRRTDVDRLLEGDGGECVRAHR